MKKLVFIISLLLLGAVAFVFKPWATFETDPYAVPDREPFDGSLLPDRAMEAVCMLGHPVMVSSLDDNLPVRFVIFPGPFLEHLGEDAGTVKYAGYYVDTPPNPQGDAVTLVPSLEEYKARSIPEELAPYRLYKLTGGVPDRLSALQDTLGEADTFIERSNPERNRHIWERPLCFEDTLVQELWVEEVDGMIIDAGASKVKKPARKL